MAETEFTTAHSANDTKRTSFLHDIIEQDLASGKHTSIVTRFPPEPNGYLHIGHAKSITLNYGLAQQYKGRFHLRFDDTNPTTEDVEYVESIKKDVRWLGADWGDHLYFASDYFEKMYQCAVHLIKKGKAYVDSLSVDDIREYRGTVFEAGRPSPYRERSVDENLDLFARMRAGEFKDGEVVLRAKIDMANPNMLMRDPLLYRVRHATHHRTGDAWCIYPMYDFAHCLEDAFEGITHSICTLEFENNRELYDWIIQETDVEWQPRQYEFARLNLGYTVMSKRKLLQLVQNNDVHGWDDPRMPTIAGLRRRGITPTAVQRFCHLIGVAKANSLVDIGLLEHAIRDELNQTTPRVMGVLRPLKVTITNYPEGATEELDVPYFPGDFPQQAMRKVPFSREIYIEQDDFMEDPPSKWYRLAPDKEVRLRFAYFIKCNEVIRDPETGEVIELLCTYDPDTLGGNAPDGRKVKGTLHWVSAKDGVPATIRLYDRLFSVERPDGDADKDFRDFLNPESLVELKHSILEPSVLSDSVDTRYQFERQGYFWRDPEDSTANNLVFTRIVSLRDSWEKEQKKSQSEKQKPAPKRQSPQKTGGDDSKNKRPASYERDQARANNPELAARLDRYLSEWKLNEDDADLLSGKLGLAIFFEHAVETFPHPTAVAAWIVNEMLPVVGDETPLSELLFTGEMVGELVELISKDTITNQASREVLSEMLKTGKNPSVIVKDKGLEKIADASSLEPIIDKILADNEANVAKYRDGKTTLLGFFIGQVMKTTGGTADAVLAKKLLLDKLSS